VFKAAGLNVEIASLSGGEVPVDEGSKQGDFFTEDSKAFVEGAATKGLLSSSKKLSDLAKNLKSYDAIFLAGGFGTIGDFKGSEELTSIVTKAFEEGVIVGAVCHGPVGLLGLKEGKESALKGMAVTGFSSAEEKACGYAEKNSVQAEMEKLGAVYTCAAEAFHPHVVTAEKNGAFCVTGQNPASSKGTAEKVVELIKKKKEQPSPTSGGVIILCTNASKVELEDVKGEKVTKDTGLWLEEAAAPYKVFKDGGLEVTVASLGGGEVPVDAGSKQGDFYTEDCKAFEEGEATKGLLSSTKKLSDLAKNLKSYDAIFLAGGFGTIGDFKGSKDLAAILAQAFKEGVVVGAVCHGPVGLLGVEEEEGKESLLKGMEVTGFSSAEEKACGYAEKNSVQAEMEKIGAAYTCADAPFKAHVVTAEKDGKVCVTGQNPASSKGAAEKVLEIIKNKKQ